MKRIHEYKIDDAKYYESIWGEEHNKRPYYDNVRMRGLIRYVKDGDSVIDVGAGVYGACQFIAETTTLNCSLTAFDQSQTAKYIVNKITPSVDYIIGECEGVLPFADSSFDKVIAGEIIEHMEYPETFAKEITRICKPGGRVSLSTVDTKCENAILHGDYPEHLWEFEPLDLIGFFQNGIVNYQIIGDYHFIYFKKL